MFSSKLVAADVAFRKGGASESENCIEPGENPGYPQNPVEGCANFHPVVVSCDGCPR